MYKSCVTCKRKIGINRNFGNNLFLLLTFSDLCHKRMLLEAPTIPLSTLTNFVQDFSYTRLFSFTELIDNIIFLSKMI